MKTAEEYTDEIATWVNQSIRNAVIEKIQEVITEHDNEIKALIDDMITKVKELKRLVGEEMGSPGADGYWDNATKDQIWEFGRYRAFEDCYDLLTELKNKLKE